jgi:hypothetical protein
VVLPNICPSVYQKSSSAADVSGSSCGASGRYGFGSDLYVFVYVGGFFVRESRVAALLFSLRTVYKFRRKVALLV